MTQQDWIDIRVLAPDSDLTIRGVECAHGAVFGVSGQDDEGVLQLTDGEGLKIPDGQVGRLAACVFGGMAQARKIAFELWDGDASLGNLTCSSPGGNAHVFWHWKSASDAYQVCLDDESAREGTAQGLSVLCMRKEPHYSAPDTCRQSVAFSVL